MQFMGNRDRKTSWLAMAANELAKQLGHGRQPMASNEHPDMSGNPCDDPIVCDQCGDACNEEDLYGSVYDEDKNFCRKECVDNWEEGWGSVLK
jgi:hypothetical protein